MTNLDKFISEVRARIEKATSGPWNAYDWPGFPRSDEYGDGCVRIESETQIAAYCFSGNPNHDAILIANAPTDLAKALQIIEVLTGALNLMQQRSRFPLEEVCAAADTFGSIYEILATYLSPVDSALTRADQIAGNK